MNRIDVVWCSSPEEEAPQGAENSIRFRITEEWVATDQDQLLLPITLLERDEEQLDEPAPAILKQYGGEGVLNSMLLSDGDMAKGSEWVIRRTKHRRTVEPTD